MQFTRLDPNRLSDQEITDATALFAATNAADQPEWPASSRESIAEQLRQLHIGPEPITFWLGRLEDGRVAAVGVMHLPQLENTSQAGVEVRVHPELRRQGVGTQMLRVLVAQAREAGRTRLLGMWVREGGAGEPWVERFGFEPVHAYIVQELQVAKTDPALWQAPVAPGYRLVEWTGAAPEDLLSSYAVARQAINDAPSGEMTWVHPQWTPERVRDEEAAHAARGAEHRVVVAVHEATGAVAGLTELFMYDRQPEHAHQNDTAVLAAHRGLGLGRAMKAAMMQRLVRERPNVERVSTQTAADNTWMARVNHQIGYRTLWKHFYVEADLDVVQARLDG